MKPYAQAKKLLEPHFGLGNCYIDDWIVNPVHQENSMNDWLQGLENDYYLDTGASFYLITIRYAEKVAIQYVDGAVYKNNLLDYFVIELDVPHLEKGRECLLESVVLMIREELRYGR